MTVLAAVRLLGLGIDSVERGAVDAQGRMRPDALEERLSRGNARARRAARGAPGSPPPRARTRRRRGTRPRAAARPRRSDRRDRSLRCRCCRPACTRSDAHKWLNVPYDSSFAIVRDSEAHRAAMALTAAYLPRDTEAERWPAEWVPELSRRARAFPVYAALRSLGREGIARIVDGCCPRAAQLAELLADVPKARILNPEDIERSAESIAAATRREAWDR